MESLPKMPQFDANVGGLEQVPFNLKLQEFTKHRIEEILMLTETLRESPFKGQAFQRLPRHMRRRQMSHNVKRLPRKLQSTAAKEAVPTVTKRPSRKFRRRPSNILLEYNRRQKKNVWLETHLWHAKRFHMIDKWGYKLPFKPADKSFRACYRASSQHCLLVDMSYYNVIELQGPEHVLLSNLQQCVSVECGLTFRSKMYMTGMREGSVTLHHPNSYPFKAVGNVKFLWKPAKEKENRFIWIWTHPSVHDEIVECFTNLFGLSKIEIVKTEKLDEERSIEEIKLEPKNVPFERTPKYINDKTSVRMILLKDTLNRFSLTGPLSQAIISQAFEVCQVKLPTSKITEEDEIEVIEVKSNGIKSLKRSRGDDEPDEIPSKKLRTGSWWEDFYGNDELNYWEKQKTFYENLKKFSNQTDLPSKMVLSLVVRDPRLTIPEKRMKSVPDEDASTKYVEVLEPELCNSPLWNSDVRDKVSESKFTTQEINTARSKLIVPGTDVGEFINGKNQSRVPVIFIQKPGETNPKRRLGYGSGWDIIIPANYAMPFWLSLIFRGARSGGLRETETLHLESSSLTSALQPDSASGKSESRKRAVELRERYFRLPPNKRPSYVKLGVVSPFLCPWEILHRDWISKIRSESAIKIKDETFFVLRNKKKLKELSDAIQNIKKQKTEFNYERYVDELNSIVEISVECRGKGRPSEFAMICMPTPEDLKVYKNNDLAPVEPMHEDKNFLNRKKLKQEHQKCLKSLRRKRKKERLELAEKIQSQPLGKKLSKKLLEKKKPENDPVLKELSFGYKRKMESLWLPEEVESVINSSSRTILGFVTKGDFSFSNANGFGLGYVTLPGLLYLLNLTWRNNAEPVVLVRNPDHVKYRFAKLNVL